MSVFEELLYQDESDWLDFKRDQYRFAGASDHEKAELLKDILAFANSWRRVDAYILIGVEEVKGDKSIVHGVAEHLDDANLQEFVNKKTNRHIEFSYRTEQLEEKSIGVIRLPVQKRPFFIKKDFGGVKAGVVKIRKGSSTFDATADEVFMMGEAYQRTGIPSVSVEFADHATKQGKGTRAEFDCIAVSVPDEDDVPDLERERGLLDVGIGMPLNADFYREVVHYHKSSHLLRPMSLRIENTGDVQIDSLKVQLHLPMRDHLSIQDCEPEAPSSNFVPNLSGVIDAVSIERVHDGWRVGFSVGSLQPKADFWTEQIFIGSTTDAEVRATVRAYGKQFADPAKSELVLKFSVTHEQREFDEILVSHLEEYDG